MCGISENRGEQGKEEQVSDKGCGTTLLKPDRPETAAVLQVDSHDHCIA